jgi:membrane carboxypeptidase/penicillin-binding protein PbpC
MIAGRSSPRPCSVHRKDAQGNVITLLPESERGGFKIVSPENGAEFQLVSGGLSERIVFRVSGNDDNGRLWWFIDGRNSGETKGKEAFVAQMEVGEHTIAAVDATGESYSIHFKVKDIKDRQEK